MIEWSEDYSTGVEEIDNQHKDLFGYINQLKDCISDEEYDGARIEIILNFLGVFCQTHFMLEETCMRQRKCPVHDKNKKAHDNFLQYFNKFKKAYSLSAEKERLIKDLDKVLSEWMINHIIKIDKHLKNCNKVHAGIF